MSLDAIFRSLDIERQYGDMDLSDLAPDLQGWGSTHNIFRHVIETHRPRVIIEIGTWKGASAVYMLQLAEELGVETEIICVDTWLGSADVLWLNPNIRPSLMLKNGYPTMFRQFIRNILAAGVARRVFPLPMTSSAAANVLIQKGVIADAIYVDGSHDGPEVLMDLTAYWRLLRAGGVMFGDDYDQYWPGVKWAVDTFCLTHKLQPVFDGNKFSFVKEAIT